MSNIEKVLNHLEDISKKGLRNFSVQNLDRKDVEKALHRILLIGVIMDYTIDYSKNEFTVTGYSKEKILEEYGKYIAGYLFSRKNVEIEKAHHFINLPISEFVINVLQLLVQFICNIIEKGRRRAII